MPVNSTCYRLGQSNNWTGEKSGESDNAGKNTSLHAEQVAYGKHNQGNVYFIVQNAFPCTGCHGFFVKKATGATCFIIRVTSDHGSYSMEHKALNGGVTPPVPCTIYYRNGAHAYNAVPGGFPAHPSVTIYG